jgi:hypothetical protein
VGDPFLFAVHHPTILAQPEEAFVSHSDHSTLTPENVITMWGSLENGRRDLISQAAECRRLGDQQGARAYEARAAHVAAMVNLRNMQRAEKARAKQIRQEQERRQHEMRSILRGLRLF